MNDPIARQVASDVERLCATSDRDLGTAGNRAATAYVAERLRGAGVDVQSIEFDVPEWRFGRTTVTADGERFDVHAGPFSPPASASGPLVVIENEDDLSAEIQPGAVLLLYGAIASTQLTPRDYPFYSNPDHAAILDTIEAARPLAMLAATGKSPMTGAMSPFPLVDEARFGVPSAYMSIEEGVRLAKHVGKAVSVSIVSQVLPSSGVQPYGCRAGTTGRRIVVSAHVDTKPETPGAIDNAAGVAVLLAVADLLRDATPQHSVEFVPFNGEDHTLAPGELAWLSANTDLSDVALNINIDAAGLRGAPSAYSLYGLDAEMTALVSLLAADHPDVAEGPAWPASDHMIFAMRGVPAIAITSTDFEAASGEYSHTPKDVPGILDFGLLADTARFVAALIERL